MTKIKICGITRPEDAVLAAELGADFIGLIFVKESPRYVAECGRIAAVLKAAALPPHSIVGVFRNSSREEVERIAREVPLDYVQLHGDESYRLDIPTIKAVNVADGIPEDVNADYALFDTGGGTGKTFDWTLVQHYTRPFFLAGGITPDNVQQAIDTANPYAIDVSSGIESAPGVKDPHKMRMLFERVRNR